MRLTDIALHPVTTALFHFNTHAFFGGLIVEIFSYLQADECHPKAFVPLFSQGPPDNVSLPLLC